MLSAVLADRYHIISNINELSQTGVDGPFDLCLVDTMALPKYQHWLNNIREQFDPIYLPVLILIDRSEAGRIPPALWQTADDILLRPVDRLELATRVQSLLRTRALSVRAQRTYDMYAQESRIAQRLQAAAIPNAFPNLPNLTCHGFYQAADVQAKVGGDWYDVMRLKCGRIVISIGDVSGSGLDAAVTMGKLRQVVRAVAQITTDPAQILAAADQTLQADEPNRYVTAFVGVLDDIGGQLEYASAGHPMPIIRRPDKSLATMAITDLLLGTGERTERVSHMVAFEPGSTMVLFTDGLTEATRDVLEGEELVQKAVRTMNFAATENPAKALYANVIHKAVNDDTAILIVNLASVNNDPAVHSYTFNSSDIGRVRAVQAEIMQILRSRNYRIDAIAAAELAFIELIGNTVRYAPGDVKVVLDSSNSAAVLHVLDGGRGFDYAPNDILNLSRESGRGLFIIRQIAESFTISRRVNGGSHARVVLPG